MYQFANAAITKQHMLLSGSNNRHLLSHSSGGQKLSCQQGGFLLRAVRATQFCASLQPLVVGWRFIRVSWLVEASLDLHSLCVCLYPNFPFSQGSKSHGNQRLTLLQADLILANYICDDPIPDVIF